MFFCDFNKAITNNASFASLCITPPAEADFTMTSFNGANPGSSYQTAPSISSNPMIVSDDEYNTTIPVFNVQLEGNLTSEYSSTNVETGQLIDGGFKYIKLPPLQYDSNGMLFGTERKNNRYIIILDVSKLGFMRGSDASHGYYYWNRIYFIPHNTNATQYENPGAVGNITINNLIPTSSYLTGSTPVDGVKRGQFNSFGQRVAVIYVETMMTLAVSPSTWIEHIHNACLLYSTFPCSMTVRGGNLQYVV